MSILKQKCFSYRPRTGLVQAPGKKAAPVRLFSPWRLKVSTALVKTLISSLLLLRKVHWLSMVTPHPSLDAPITNVTPVTQDIPVTPGTPITPVQPRPSFIFMPHPKLICLCSSQFFFSSTLWITPSTWVNTPIHQVHLDQLPISRTFLKQVFLFNE